MKVKKKCPHCGASMMEHRHVLSESLIICLARLYDAGGGPLNIKELGFTHNQWCNFSKLKYWGVTSNHGVDGSLKSGQWALTQLGRDFLEGRSTIQRYVWTYRGEWVRFEGEQSSIHDLYAVGYRKRADYAADAVPHQTSLNLP